MFIQRRNMEESNVPFPQPISFNNNEYYNSKDLMAYKRAFYFGCSRHHRTIITKKIIPSDDYIYVIQKQKEWKNSTEECKRAQILISKRWVDINYFQTVQKKEDENNSLIAEEYNVAPALIELSTDEKFVDNDGNIIEIETRGEKTENGIYFKVSDIAKGFDIKYLDDTIYHSNYIKDTDYNIFILKVPTNVRNLQNKNYNTSFQKTLYLTYIGLCRVLFVSRNKNVQRFQKWAVNKLFTIQMGAKLERKKLAAELCGITTKQLVSVFEANCATCFPSIYLICLGLVKLLRPTFNISPEIPEDCSVYKFGFTRDLSRRMTDHNKNYGKMKNVSISVIAFHYIDQKYINDAEREVREFCKSFDLRLKIGNTTEFIALNSKQLPQVKTQYRHIGRSYSGATLEMQNKIEELTTAIKDNNTRYEAHLKEKEIEFLQQEIKLKDERHKLECLQIKHQAATENHQLAISNMQYQLELNNQKNINNV